MPTIFIVSIASGDPELLNTKTINTIKHSGHVYLRTDKTPFIEWLNQEKIGYSSFDCIYESADDFETLSVLISKALWAYASESDIVYAVSDLKTDTAVNSLYECRPGDGIISVIPGPGITDVYLSRLCPYLKNTDLRMVTATDYLLSAYDPNISVLISELDNPILTSEVKLSLGTFWDDEDTVVYLHDKDDPVHIPLYQLDRLNHIDHLSAVFIPASAYQNRQKFVMYDLLCIMDTLRSDNGCPWDRKQTHVSLLPYLIEEAWECAASIEQHDYDHLAEELGDLLFQIVFHASIGKTFDEFSMNDVVSAICMKMIRRHPHVFNSNVEITSDEVVNSWEKLKQEETGHKSLLSSLDDVSAYLPSLKYATKTCKKIRQGEAFRRSDQQIIHDIIREAEQNCNDSSPSGRTIGKILLFCCELSLNNNFDPELLLHRSVDSLKEKLKLLDSIVKNDGKTLEHLTFEELGVYFKYVEGEIE